MCGISCRFDMQNALLLAPRGIDAPDTCCPLTWRYDARGGFPSSAGALLPSAEDGRQQTVSCIRTTVSPLLRL